MGGVKVWQFFGKYNVYCPNREIRDQVLTITGATERSIYYLPDGTRAFDVLVPKRFKGRVEKMLQSAELAL